LKQLTLENDQWICPNVIAEKGKIEKQRNGDYMLCIELLDMKLLKTFTMLYIMVIVYVLFADNRINW